MSDITKIPKHLSIIMDGNGRWAQKQGFDKRILGHKAGLDSVTEIVKEACKQNIRYLSLFAFSDENWGRPKDEIDGLMSLFMDAIIGERALFFKERVRFRAIGDLSKLSQELNDKIYDLESSTMEFDKLTLVVMLSYSGKWDIMQAMKRYCCNEKYDGVSEPDSEKFSAYLATSDIPDPDLLIRTSGEQRISNYMLWQTAYTEFYFTEVLWPDFRKDDLLAALKAFSGRERRYGKTAAQIIEQK